MVTEVKELIEKVEKTLAEIKERVNAREVVESIRFKLLSDGWIFDKALGLDFGPSSINRMDFEEAKKYAANQGGRLPTVKELRSLIDYDRCNPAIDTKFFKDTKTDDWYWTGTEVSGFPSSAWIVSFSNGYVGWSNEDNYNYVRPCRASQCLIL